MSCILFGAWYNMRIISYLLCLFANSVAASPASSPANLSKRQWTGITSKEFSLGGCRDVIFVFARGSQETGNMGTIVGPPLSNGLKLLFGPYHVATEGIDYYSLPATNFLRGGCDPAGTNAMIAMLTVASSICPNSILVAGGYSQGAAVCHRGIEYLPSVVKDRIAGVVTFGDTQTLQDKGQIDYFPKNKVKIICNIGDLVCIGTLIVNMPVHLDYTRRVPEAVTFLSRKILEEAAKDGPPKHPNTTVDLTPIINHVMSLTAPILDSMTTNDTSINSTAINKTQESEKGERIKEILKSVKMNLTAVESSSGGTAT